jgi:hypothetical protein
MKPAKRTRKVQTDKATHMSDEAFADLKQALEGARAFERGERLDLDVTRIQKRCGESVPFNTKLASDETLSAPKRFCLFRTRP